ncbi:ATP-binding cassette domain-containing protein, partial [Nocardia sp. NPDC003354]
EVRGKYSSAAAKAQLAYAEALAAWGETGGYDAEVLFDTVATIVLDLPWDSARDRPVRTLSGGQQKRFALELLLRGPDEVLLLDEPDNFLDVPGKRWLEGRLRESVKSVLYVSHDRELLAQTADRVVAVEGGSAWVHPGGFASWHDARVARHARLDELRKRWDEEHQKLRELMLMYKQKAAYNDGMASRYRAAQTRLRKFEEAGPPPEPPREQDIRMRLKGGRTGVRAVTCGQLELTGLMKPFDLEVFYGERVAVLGSNGSGKSTLLRAIAGLLPAERGKVYTDGQPSLLGVNAALMNDLTGERNVILGGLAMGMSREQIKERYQEIVDFSGINEKGDFITLPMRTYSSGMAARLRFSIAAAKDHDVLLVDEALATGDRSFQTRSEERIRELKKKAGTIFLVSHNNKSIRDTCNRVLWLERGELRMDGPTDEVLKEYEKFTGGPGAKPKAAPKAATKAATKDAPKPAPKAEAVA